MRGLLFCLLALSYSICSAQSILYKTIGIGVNLYIPSTSKPTNYNNDNAAATGIFGELYFENKVKLKLGINYFYNTYKAKYIDTATRPKVFVFNTDARFITLPVLVSYNFISGEDKWAFFVDAGYEAFIHQKTTLQNFNNALPLTPYDRNINYKSAHYFIAGVNGQYTIDKKWVLGMGTKSYHYLPFGNKKSKGFPTVSIDLTAAIRL